MIPFTSNPGSGQWSDYLHNEVWSPVIPFQEDIDGLPVPWGAQTLILEFDVYRDLPLDNAMYYTFRVRFMVDGCFVPWEKLDEFWWGDDKQWFRHVADFNEKVAPGATHMQVALSAADWCSVFCQTSASGTCHSHAPLFDNVKVYRVLELVSAAGDTPSANRLDQNYPNPFNPTTTIGYSIEEAGHVRLSVYNVAGQLVRTLVDEIASPRSGGFTAQWDGVDGHGTAVSTGIYFYRLETAGYVETRKMVLLK